jgi:hypothetical protein
MNKITFHKLNFLVTFSIIFLSLILVYLFNDKSFDSIQNPETKKIPILSVTSKAGDGVGVDYYAELARSFLHGKTYFLNPTNKELSKEPNPYGGEAFDKHIIIQDASFYRDKYYIYHGPLPAIFYIFIRVTSGFYPSDMFISSILIFTLSIIFLVYAKKTIIEPLNYKLQGLSLTAALYSILFFNPLVLMSFGATIHNISRTCAIALTCLALIQIMEREKSKYNNYLLCILLASLAGLCKVNFFLDALIILLFCLYKNNSLSISKKTILCSPFVICLASQFLYNHQRFNNMLESGVKYMTNSLDFYHGIHSVFYFSLSPAYIYTIIIKKTNEYFTSGFTLNSAQKITPSYFGYPFSGEANLYSEGNIGLLIVAPVSIIFFILLYQNIKNNFLDANLNNFKIDKFIDINLLIIFLFLIHLSMTYFNMMTSFRYTLEFLPFIAIYVISNKKNYYKFANSNFKNVLIIFLSFISFGLSFSL